MSKNIFKEGNIVCWQIKYFRWIYFIEELDSTSIHETPIAYWRIKKLK